MGIKVKGIPAGKIAASVVCASSMAASYVIGKGIDMIPGSHPVKLVASSFVGGILGEAAGKVLMNLWH